MLTIDFSTINLDPFFFKLGFFSGTGLAIIIASFLLGGGGE